VYLTNNHTAIANMGSLIGTPGVSWNTYTGNTTAYLQTGTLGISIVFQGFLGTTGNYGVTLDLSGTPNDENWRFGMAQSVVNIVRVM